MKNAFTIENDYKEYLMTLKSLNTTMRSIKDDRIKYNELAEKTLEFISKVVLLRCSRNRNLINSTGYEFDMFADDISMHIINKLDIILSCDKENMIRFIVTLSNNKVLDIFRKWNRTYPSLTPPKTPYTSADSNNGGNNTETENKSVFNFLDDVSWGFIAADTNIETEILNKEQEIEQHTTVLKALKNTNSCTRFEVLSLLATKVITISDNRCTKTRKLAEAIDTHGLYSVSVEYFEMASTIFNISYEDYFDCFSNDFTPKYNSIDDLCNKISHASNSCSIKLCKKVGATRIIKKRSKQSSTISHGIEG